MCLNSLECGILVDKIIAGDYASQLIICDYLANVAYSPKCVIFSYTCLLTEPRTKGKYTSSTSENIL